MLLSVITARSKTQELGRKIKTWLRAIRQDANSCTVASPQKKRTASFGAGQPIRRQPGVECRGNDRPF